MFIERLRVGVVGAVCGLAIFAGGCEREEGLDSPIDGDALDEIVDNFYVYDGLCLQDVVEFEPDAPGDSPDAFGVVDVQIGEAESGREVPIVITVGRLHPEQLEGVDEVIVRAYPLPGAAGARFDIHPLPAQNWGALLPREELDPVLWDGDDTENYIDGDRAGVMLTFGAPVMGCDLTALRGEIYADEPGDYTLHVEVILRSGNASLGNAMRLPFTLASSPMDG